MPSRTTPVLLPNALDNPEPRNIPIGVIMLKRRITFHLGLPNGIDLIIEYITAFVMGLLIFQALFMKSSMGGSILLPIKNEV